jgi:hypothetical protein
MAQVNYLNTFTLHYPAHYVNSRIVPVKQGGGRNYPYFIFQLQAHNSI